MKKPWTDLQAHFIKAQDDLRECQQISHQGGYGANKLIRIEEAFTNLSQETADDRAEVTNLTGANMNLTTKVSKYAIHMVTNDSYMVSQLQW